MLPQQEKQLLGLDLQQLTAVAAEMGQPAYRGRQLFEAVYAQRLADLASVTTLPLSLREAMAGAGYAISHPKVEQKFSSVDGTIRYLMAFADGQSVETVWMPEGDGGEAGDGSDEGEGRGFDRATICVSSQVGCAVNCQFCLTAALGVKRNLTAGEIVGQILVVLEDNKVEVGSDRINLVFMGMGEPFLNYDNFMQAVRLLVEGVGLSAQRMTVSTAGIVPRIYDFAQEPVRPKLAISLNAPNDELRERIMPITRKWDIGQIMDAVRQFPLRPREQLTFEYVLLNGVNDGEEHARQVIKLVKGLPAKVNLIALNPGPGIAFGTPEQSRVLRFQELLVKAGVPAFIRRPRGRDIYAACGQLKRTVSLTQIGIQTGPQAGA